MAERIVYDLSKALRIYVAGPYTHGDTAVNVRNAVNVAHFLADFGVVPYIPHLTHFWHFLQPREYEYWLEYDKHWLVLCNGLVRIPGMSTGADAEVSWAEGRGLPVFYLKGAGYEDLTELTEWLKKVQADAKQKQ
jgi:hypothetical protein